MSILPRHCRRCGGSIPGNGQHSCEGSRARKRGEITHERDGKWWNWDRHHYRRVGPFDTKLEAQVAFFEAIGVSEKMLADMWRRDADMQRIRSIALCWLGGTRIHTPTPAETKPDSRRVLSRRAN